MLAQFSRSIWGDEQRTIVQDMIKAHRAAIGYSLTAWITPDFCSAISASMAAALYDSSLASFSRLWESST